ncbi:MAG: hypothetical protein ACE37F_05455 [Nannocystaceae bacterium]|nr:hypothetical protein [bacterium]
MQHWSAGIVVNLLAMAVLLALAAGLRNRIGPLRRLGIPDCIIAGSIGLTLGPSGVDVLPLSIPDLELFVYHGFALVFIAVGLQRASEGARPGGARSVAVAIPTLAVLQVTIGLLVVGAWHLWGELHPGFGLLPMLGFSQGPGQALSLGGAWEPLGLVDGTQLGLTFAAAGFATCIVLGIPTVAYARRAGWITRPQADDGGNTDTSVTASTSGTMDPLTGSVVAIGVVYAGAFGFIWLLVRVLPEGSSLIPTAWGFHFVVGALLAMATRRLARATHREDVFNDRLLGRLAVLAVDFTTTAALCAVQLSVVGRWLVPVLVISLLIGVLTLLTCLWIARRAFPQEPFEHAIMMFGMSSGTLPTGLALLRTVDPELRGTVARNATMGVSGSIPFMAPLLVGVIPFAVSLWPQGIGAAVGIPLAIMVAYVAALSLAWRSFTPARAMRPWSSLWPPDP